MAEQIQYELSLKDDLSAKIQQADKHVNHLEKSMGSLGGSMGHMVESLGISFAIFKGMEFVKEGVESMEKVHQAEAQLQNTMEHLCTYSAESFEKAVAGAGELSKSIKFSRADIIELQSQLGLVGNIGESEMGRITKVSADLATKMGMGLDEAGNMLAKAINAPEMARRLGMALKIDPAVMAHVQNLAKHGKEAEARMELLALAESKVGGAAEAAFNADPLARFNKTMGSIKNDVGGLAIDFMKKLVPALEWMAGAFKTASVWIKEHKQLVEILGDVLLGAGTAIGAIIVATKSWAMIQWVLNAAMLDNPIGIVITAIGALVGWAIYAYTHFDKFRGVVWATWAVLKEVASLIMDAWTAVYHVLHGALTFNWSEVKDGLSAGISVVTDAAKRIGEAAAKGYHDGVADFAKDQKSLIPQPGKTGKGAAQAVTQPPKEPKTKATGNKSVTINVHIKDLIGVQNINTTNLKEGAGKIKDMVVQVLSSAVNDFQVISNH